MAEKRSQGRKRERLPAEARREQILVVAAKVFAEKGYRVASVTDIVEGAHMGRGTFYLYFDSKREVFLELIEKYFEGFEAVLRDNHRRVRSSARDNGDLLEVWRDNIVRLLEYHCERPELTSVVYHDAVGRDADFREKVEELSEVARKHLKEELNTMARHGLVRKCDLDVVTSIVLGSTVYAIMEHVVMGESGHRNLQELAAEIIGYHVRALVPVNGQGRLDDFLGELGPRHAGAKGRPPAKRQ